jgi:hypothetical protein
MTPGSSGVCCRSGLYGFAGVLDQVGHGLVDKAAIDVELDGLFRVAGLELQRLSSAAFCSTSASRTRPVRSLGSKLGTWHSGKRRELVDHAADVAHLALTMVSVHWSKDLAVAGDLVAVLAAQAFCRQLDWVSAGS